MLIKQKASALQLRLSAGKTRFHLIAESIPHQIFSGHSGLTQAIHSRPPFISFGISRENQYKNPTIAGKTFYYWTYDLFLDSPKRSKNLAISIFSFIINKSKSFSKKHSG
ncbi:hypothetical protein ACFUP3_21400 [Bacillus paralicheniformis]|uniref:hypothetical protein n=1 Tax=Bacillus paralicheniformis TaxID=1648923 RepID=UPI003626DC24